MSASEQHANEPRWLRSVSPAAWRLETLQVDQLTAIEPDEPIELREYRRVGRF